MLANLHKKTWTDGLILQDFADHSKSNENTAVSLAKLSVEYNKSVIEEFAMTADQLKVRHIGKADPKKKLEETVREAMTSNIVQCLGSMVDAVSF